MSFAEVLVFHRLVVGHDLLVGLAWEPDLLEIGEERLCCPF